MKYGKRYLWSLAAFCFVSGATLVLHAKIDQEDTAQALTKLSNKFKEKEHKISTQSTHTHETIDNTDEEAEVTPHGMSTKTKILIGVSATGLITAAIVWAVIAKQREAERKQQEEERRRQEEERRLQEERQRTENRRLGIPTNDEIRENERLWNQTERVVRERLRRNPPPPAPAEFQGPDIIRVEDVTADPAYVDYEPVRHGLCIACLEEKNLLHMHGRHSLCRDCFLGQLFAHYNAGRAHQEGEEDFPGRARFDMIICPDVNRPDVIFQAQLQGQNPQEPLAREYLTREDIRRITHNNPRMLNTYDIAHYNHLYPGARNLGRVSLEQRQYSRPCPACLAPTTRPAGCRHITCNCGHEYCYWCLRPHPGSHHAVPDCGRIEWGHAQR